MNVELGRSFSPTMVARCDGAPCALSHFPQPTVLPKWQLNSCHDSYVTTGVEWANTPVIRFRCTLKRRNGCNEFRDLLPIMASRSVCVCSFGMFNPIIR